MLALHIIRIPSLPIGASCLKKEEETNKKALKANTLPPYLVADGALRRALRVGGGDGVVEGLVRPRHHLHLLVARGAPARPLPVPRPTPAAGDRVHLLHLRVVPDRRGVAVQVVYEVNPLERSKLETRFSHFIMGARVETTRYRAQG